MAIQKKMDSESYENRLKELAVALERKKQELNELNGLLNNEKEERKRTQIQVSGDNNFFIDEIISLKLCGANSVLIPK